MKIESIIRRAKGTKVTFDDTTYHFKPEDPKGPHVAEVKDEEHIERFLAIPEGFREAEKPAKAAPAKPTVPEQPAASAGATVLQGEDGAGEAGGNAEAKPSAKPRGKAGKAVVPAKEKAA